jgi:hypothetical protein
VAVNRGLTFWPAADEDAEFAAAAITRAALHHPVRADQLLLIRRHLELRGSVRRFLVEQDGRSAGWALGIRIAQTWLWQVTGTGMARLGTLGVSLPSPDATV